MQYTVFGIFNDRENASEAINKLKNEGFDTRDLSIVLKDTEEGRVLANDTGANVTGGAVSGVATGAVLGGIAGLVAAFMIPGLGAFLIGGPIAAALGLTGAGAATVSGAATGAVAGGLLGALMGLGLPKEDAQMYENRIREGGILVAVPATAETYEEAQACLADCDATDVKAVTMPTDRMQTRTEKATTQNQRTMQTQSQPAYAFGAKGGRTSGKTRSTRSSKRSPSGKGWHGDTKGHAKAAKGEEA